MIRSNYRLKVHDRGLRSGLGTYDIGVLKFDPPTFVVESKKLDNRMIEASRQVKSYEDFKANPRRPVTYVVAGNPDDLKARYFAYHLAEIHMQALGAKEDVKFETMLGNFNNPLIVNSEASPTLLVVSNLTIRSSNLKFEKTRDLLERFPKIPKIIVVAGEDPISFAATRLHVPCHAIAYFPSKHSKVVQEVI